jgi:hypothetical protein
MRPIAILLGITLTASIASADTLYLNTFDDAGSFNIDTDTTDAATFFPSPPSGSTVSEQAFGGGDTNTGSAAAGGDYALMTREAGLNKATTNNDAGNTFTTFIDLLNDLPLGEYTWRYAFDWASDLDGSTGHRMNLSVVMEGAGSGGNGKWLDGNARTVLGDSDDVNTFKHFTSGQTTFSVVETLAEANDTNGHFVVGSFTGLDFRFSPAAQNFSSPPSEATFKLDNFAIQSDTIVIPEPATLALVGLGGVLMARRRRN